MAGPPLNVDKREWAIDELKRLEEENAVLKKENEALKQELENQGGSGEIPAKAYKPGEGDV